MGIKVNHGYPWIRSLIIRVGCGFILLSCLSLQPAPAVIAVEAPSGECMDSDHGLKYYRQGRVIEFLGLPFEDQCSSPESLLEYTCADTGEAVANDYQCPNGCVDGACIGPNIIVIGWDGAQWDHLEQCFTQELTECPIGLPNLAALSSGRIFQSTTTNGPTNTKPGWAQILTGYDTKVIRVYDSRHYFPIQEGYTVFEKIESYFGEENVRSIFLSGKGYHTGGDESEIWYLTKNHLNFFESEFYKNEVVGNKALAQLEASQNDLFFAFFLFWEPDTTGHKTGEDSINYSAAILDADDWLGKIVEKLRELGIMENTLIYVTTDHGFDEFGYYHANAPYGFLASNDPLVIRNADRRDLAATILDRYGITREAIDGVPALDGNSLYSSTPFDCVPEGETYLDYPDAPACCSGLSLINLDKRFGHNCIPATGGTGNSTGYCTACGNGTCGQNESWCNCPADCPQYLNSVISPLLNNRSFGK